MASSGVERRRATYAKDKSPCCSLRVPARPAQAVIKPNPQAFVHRDGQYFPLAGTPLLRHLPSSGMADVRITFTRDRAAAAKRLRDAVSAEGYDVALAEISDVEALIEAEDRHQTATVLIWSRPLLSSALRPGSLRKLRQQRKLIEVSPDGVGPDGGDGDQHVILISGWRGQPFHPGWQRLASELKRLCEAPRKAAEVPAPLERVEVPAAPQPIPSETRGRKWNPKAGKLALALLAGIGMFGAGFATSTLLRIGGSGTQAPPAAEMQTDEVKRAPVAADGLVVPDGAAVGPSTPPPPSGIAPAGPATVEPRPTPPLSAATPPSPAAREGWKSASRRAKKESETRLTKGNSPVRGETKRYSRRNSEIMRGFCQGSGRSTPQCRIFLRSTRGSRR